MRGDKTLNCLWGVDQSITATVVEKNKQRKDAFILNMRYYFEI